MYDNRVRKYLIEEKGFDLSKSCKFPKGNVIPHGTLYWVWKRKDGAWDMNIDDSLCLYLIDVAETSIVNFYKMVSCFVQLLRNCINQTGFGMITGVEPIENENDCKWPNSSCQNPNEYITILKKLKSQLFTQTNKPDIIPHFAQTFVGEYLQEKCNIFP